METIKCELCGSNDILKVDGMFVCQYCGTKYSVEEAKKIMLEGTVDVKGTVKVDNTDTVERFLQNAHRAKQKQDCEETEKYYNLVEASQPENWEAVYYSAYAKIMKFQTDILHIIPAIDVLLNSMDQIIYQVEKLPQDKEGDFLSKISSELKKLTANISKETITGAQANLYMLSHMLKVRGKLARIHYAFADELDEKIEKYDLAKQLILENYKEGNLLTVQPFTPNQQWLINHGDVQAYNIQKNENIRLRGQYIIKTKALDQEYVPPKEPGGCYVATAVYGSYNCPEVWTLRRYRDNNLKKTWYGRKFVKIYYKLSPKVLEIFGNKVWFNKIVKQKLDIMVKKLQNKGILSTPYVDKE